MGCRLCKVVATLAVTAAITRDLLGWGPIFWGLHIMDNRQRDGWADCRLLSDGCRLLSDGCRLTRCARMSINTVCSIGSPSSVLRCMQRCDAASRKSDVHLSSRGQKSRTRRWSTQAACMRSQHAGAMRRVLWAQRRPQCPSSPLSGSAHRVVHLRKQMGGLSNRTGSDNHAGRQRTCCMQKLVAGTSKRRLSRVGHVRGLHHTDQRREKRQTPLPSCAVLGNASTARADHHLGRAACNEQCSSAEPKPAQPARDNLHTWRRRIVAP